MVVGESKYYHVVVDQTARWNSLGLLILEHDVKSHLTTYSTEYAKSRGGIMLLYVNWWVVVYDLRKQRSNNMLVSAEAEQGSSQPTNQHSVYIICWKQHQSKKLRTWDYCLHCWNIEIQFVGFVSYIALALVPTLYVISTLPNADYIHPSRE